MTGSLIREPLRSGHADELWAIRSDERVTPWLGGAVRRDEHETRVGELAAEWDGGFGLWVVRDATTGEAVGWGGVHPAVIEDVLESEAAWTVAPDRWGEGIATWVGRAGLDLAREVGLANVVAITLPANAASRAVMERIGMAYERDVVDAAQPHVLYRITLAPPAR